MIIDLIHDRRRFEDLILAGKTYVVDGCSGKKIPLAYNPEAFRARIAGYSDVFPGITAPILQAFDAGTEGTVKAALCRYIIEQDYNPDICGWICSVPWLERGPAPRPAGKARAPRKPYTVQQVKALARILKSCATREVYTKVHQLKDGRYFICDGYRAVRYSVNIPDLQHASKEDAAMISDSLPHLAGIVDDTANKAAGIVPVDMEDVKAAIAGNKGAAKKNAIIFELDGVRFGLDPEFLRDMLQALPGCTMYKPENPRSPVYFSSEFGDGILLPIRLAENA